MLKGKLRKEYWLVRGYAVQSMGDIANRIGGKISKETYELTLNRREVDGLDRVIIILWFYWVKRFIIII